MPTIDTEAARRDVRRAYLKGLKRGDYITAGGGPASMVIGGKVVTMAPALSEAERKAEADRWWRKSCGPW